ncbi:unnamed protein product, partial [Didymodactylos carnosus]
INYLLSDTSDDEHIMSENSPIDYSVDIVTEADLPDLLPLMRAYCTFYEETENISPQPTDDLLLLLCRKLISDPEHEGIQFIVRQQNRSIGFATLYWTWQTLTASRVAVMNDLYVEPESRKHGIATRLIERCRDYARSHGASCLKWLTSNKNLRAQSVYDKTGAIKSSKWIDYELSL